MYKGERDDHISIRVPQAHCEYFVNKLGKFVEVKLPGFTDSEWESFMVGVGQVYYDHIWPDVFNIIENLNRGTALKVSRKIKDLNTGNVTILRDTEREVDPTIMLSYFRACN